MLGFIKRRSKELNIPLVTRNVYITIVRPVFVYSSQVWSPCYILHIDRIESIQNRFALFALNHLPWDNIIIVPSNRERETQSKSFKYIKYKERSSRSYLPACITL